MTQFQLLMHDDDTLELRLADGSTAASPFARCRAALLRYLQHQGVTGLRVVHGRSPPALQTGSGKLRRVIDLRRR